MAAAWRERLETGLLLLDSDRKVFGLLSEVKRKRSRDGGCGMRANGAPHPPSPGYFDASTDIGGLTTMTRRTEERCSMNQRPRGESRSS